MIEAFKHCKLVLSVDGTFLTGMYKGQMLTCIGVDANNQVVPIAFAFVESENTESWLWFLSLIKRVVVCEQPNVCVLHDRHKGILSAVRNCRKVAMFTLPGLTCIVGGACGIWVQTFTRSFEASGSRISSRNCVNRISIASLMNYEHFSIS